MKKIKKIKFDEIRDDLVKNEGSRLYQFIYRQFLEKLPSDIVWYQVRIQKNDLLRICVISSDDWAPITQKTFLLSQVDRFTPAYDVYSMTISRDIERNLAFLYAINNSEVKSKKLILVGETLENGPFTIIEGNRRASALFIANKLVGKTVFLGVSKKIKDYWWARYNMYVPR